MPRDTLIVFFRALTAGKVMTRLAASVGINSALSLYSAMLDDLAMHIDVLAQERSLAVVPFVDAVGHTGPFLKAEVQRGDSIFERMADAFERTLQTAPERVVLVGSDIPYLDSSAIEELFQGLHSTDACLGPSTDGGYYGIGFRSYAYRRDALVPGNNGLRERAGDVLSSTETLLERLELTHRRARTLQDVDTMADLLAVSQRSDFQSVCPALYSATNYMQKG